MTTPLSKAIFAIIRKDLRAEFRTKELISAMLLFALLSILIFSLALDLEPKAKRQVAAGVLWVTVIFASFLGLNRSMATEKEQGSMDAMMVAPIPRFAIYAGKLFGNFLFTLVIGLILLPLISMLYDMNISRLEMVMLLSLGILGLSAVGTLLSAMTVQTRSRETLLPIVMMPVTLPILLIVISASTDIINDDLTLSWLLNLIFIDIVYLGMGALMFEYVIEE